MLQEVGNSSHLVYFPFLGRKMVGCSSFLSSVLRLGEDMELPQEERGLRLGEGVCLGIGMYA